MGVGGLKHPPPPNKNIAPQTKWSPLALFRARAYVFCFFNIIFDQMKEPIAGVWENIGSNFSQN